MTTRYLSSLFLLVGIVVASCTEAETDGISSYETGSEPTTNVASTFSSTSSPTSTVEKQQFEIVKNNVTRAAASAALGCIGDSMSVPINLTQFDDNPTFEDLFSNFARPWYVKIEQAGLASGQLFFASGENPDAYIKMFIRAYDMPMDAFSVAAILDSKWSVLSTLWQESLRYGLNQFEKTKNVTDAAYATLAAYESSWTSACRIAIEEAIENASEIGLPLSTYLYIQLTEYLLAWHPRHFSADGLEKFETYFKVVEK